MIQDEIVVHILKALSEGDVTSRVFGSQILSNLTRDDENVSNLVGSTSRPNKAFDEAFFPAVMAFLSNSEPPPPEADPFSHFPLVLGNIAQCQRGRKYFTASNCRILGRILPSLSAQNRFRRLGVAHVIRNLLIDESMHDDVLQCDDIVATVAARLIGPAHQFDEGDMANFHPLLAEAARAEERWFESDGEVRLKLCEVLLLLARSKTGREGVKAFGVYPVLRELHKGEGEEEIKDVIESVVDLVMLKDD
jgi:hypothetical protein